MRITSTRQLMQLVAVIGVFATACSSGGDGTTPTTPPPPTPTVSSVAIAPAALALVGAGAGGTLDATVTTTAGVDNAAIVTWSSSSPAVATVSGSGRTGQVTSVGVGTSVITATSGGRSATATVTVTEAPRALSVSITGTGAGRVTSTPAGIDCVNGPTSGCNATFAFGTTVTLSATATAGSAFDGWTGVCTGTTTCAVTADASKSVQATFRLLPVPVATVVVAPSPLTLAPGASAQLSATTRDAAGSTLTGRAVTWSSADTLVAVVSSSGVVTGRSVGGPVLVTATSEGVRGTTAVTVQSPFITAVSVGLGNTSACAAEASGVTWCWGRNVYGVIGNGQTGSIVGATRVNTTQAFVEVDVGFSHACARTAAGSVYCWGTSEWGAIGDGTILPRYLATPVIGGRVASRVSLAYESACLVDGAGFASCWGRNQGGSLGVAASSSQVTQPSTLAGGIAFRTFRVTGDLNSYSGCGIATDGVSYCWGDNSYGQIGDSTANRSPSPVRLRNPRAYIDIAPGGFHTCAIDTNGAAWCWGYAFNGAIGTGQNATGWFFGPQSVATTQRFTSITSGREHSCALIADGTAYCWGLNANGQLGDNSLTNRNAPVPVATSVKFTRLVAKEHSTCGIATTTVVYCWGANGFGQVGSGSSLSVTTPSAVPRP